MQKTKEELTKQYADAMAGLDSLIKAMDEGETDDGAEALEKAREELEEAKAGFDAYLAKAKKEEGEDDDKGEDEKEDDGEDDDLQKAISAALGDDLDPETTAELIKASDAYEALEGSVESLTKSLENGMERMDKSLDSQTNLLVALAKAVGGISRRLEAIEATPVAGPKSRLAGETHEESEPIQKSRTECQELLTKAVTDGKVDPRWLSVFGARGMTALEGQIPLEVLQAAGIR